MKILLIRPIFSVERFYFPRFINESLGIEYLSSLVQKNHEVKIIDALAENWNNYWEPKDYPEIIFQGMKPKKLAKKIKDYNPEIIGITWPFSTQNNSINLAIKIIKKINKNILIIVGGPHPSSSPEMILKENKDINIVVYGEGEITLKEILDNKAKNLEKIQGIAFRKNSKIIVNSPRPLIQNLDDLLFPNREHKYHKNYSKQHLYEAIYLRLQKLGLNYKKNIKITSFLSKIPFLYKIYKIIYNKRNHKKSLPSADIITSRGCPNYCTFCAIHNIWGHQLRMRSAENIVKEIDMLVKKFKIKHINIQDDNFTVSKERTIEMCKKIIENKYNITLSTPSGVFIPTLDEEVLTWLKKAGLNEIRMSIESGNENILHNVIKKNIDLTKVKGIVDACKKVKIETEGVFIFGIPGETIKTMKQSIKFAKKSGFDRMIRFIFQPFPNTELYKLCKRKKYLTKDYDPKRLYPAGNKCYVKTENLSPKDVVKMVDRQY